MDSNQQNILELNLISSNEHIKKKRRFQLIKIIGNGAEGYVYLAKPIEWCYNVETVALKQQKQTSDKIWDFYIQLIEQQQEKEKNSLQSKSNIIRIYEICQDDEHFYIIMEIGGQDLYNYLKKNQQLELQYKFKICQNLAQSILELHSIKYIHRDIKPENFIRIGDQFKLVDFGLTKSISFFQNTLGVGSRIFQAPELLQGDGKYSSSVDIWALGCTFYEVLALKPLIEAQTLIEAQEIILNHTKNDDYIYKRINKLAVPSEWKDLLVKMFNPQSEGRISTIQLVESINQLINPEPQDKKINHFFAQHPADIAEGNYIPINPKNIANSNLKKVPQKTIFQPPLFTNNLLVQTPQRPGTLKPQVTFSEKVDLKQCQESFKPFPFQEKQLFGKLNTLPFVQTQNLQFQGAWNPTHLQIIGSKVNLMQPSEIKVKQVEAENSKLNQIISDLERKLTLQTVSKTKLEEVIEKLKEENTQLRKQNENIIDQFKKCNDQFNQVFKQLIG